jgi:phage I-like protein
MLRTAPRLSALACAIAIAACAFDASAVAPAAEGAPGSGRVLLQLTPAQDFTPADGREMDVPAWRIDQAIAGRVIAAFNAAQPPVIDYEHQTLHKEANGQPAPAAGWMHGLRWIEGRGLFAEVELTQRARELVQAGEYRYFSPVFEYAKATGEIVRILMGALTNHPAIAGMEGVSLTAAATARFLPPHHPPETTVNLLEKLLAAIGLPATTTEDAAVAACTAIKAQADAARAALQLDGNASAETVTAACTSLRTAAASATPDPAKFVPVAVVEELKTSVAALTAQNAERQVEDLVAPALADGRLLPAQEAWARDLGKTNVAALTQYLKTAQPIAALAGTQTQGKPPAAGAQENHGLTADELAVAAACGMTPEAYAKGKA